MTAQIQPASVPVVIPGYLVDILATLLMVERVVDNFPFAPTIELVGDQLYRIEFEGGCMLLVDTRCEATDDPDNALPAPFLTKILAVHEYRVTWRDADGLPREATVNASCRSYARLFARAPENTYVERI